MGLGHNQIKTVGDGDWAGLPALRRLDLSHNEVEKVAGTAFQVGNNRKSDLSKNEDFYSLNC